MTEPLAPPPLDDTDAMTITIVAINALASLPDELTHDQKLGARFYFDTLMQAVKPHLPQTPALAHIFTLIADNERLIAAVRARLGAPARI